MPVSSRARDAASSELWNIPVTFLAIVLIGVIAFDLAAEQAWLISTGYPESDPRPGLDRVA